MVLNTLPAREKRVIELRFGLEDGTEYTFEEIGAKFGISNQRAQQIESKALKMLRHPSRSASLKEYLN